MSDLSETAPLRYAPDLRVDFGHGGAVTVISPHGRATVGPAGSAVLDAFRHPCDPAAAVERLAATGYVRETIRDLVARLIDAGALEPATGAPTLRPDGDIYDSATIHVAMLNDRTRVEAFLAGIREVVRPGDVVVDFGSRTGLLAITAALAGAARVYAVTIGGGGELVTQGAARNGVVDRVVVVPGWPAWDDLPPAADVLVAEALSYDLASAQLAALLRKARGRLLGPGGRVVPEAIALRACLVQVPEAERFRRTFAPAVAGRWREWYGIDFGPCAAASARAGALFPAEASAVAGWPRVGLAVTLCADLIDAAEDLDGGWPLTTTLTAAEAGVFDGVALGCATRLGPGRLLPGAEGRSWPQERVWLLPEPRCVAPGDRITLTYRRGLPPPGDRMEIAVGA